MIGEQFSEGALAKELARPRRKLRRNEKHEATRRRLFAAAIKVVGQYGYAEASVARITAEAGVAQGTFYLHFENRQALLDELLPVVGEAIIEAVRERGYDGTSEEEREIERCKAFFEVLMEVPEFFRIQNEAELFAPEGYRKHTESVIAGYVRALRRGFDADDPDGYTDDELEVVAHVLLGARACLGKRYANLDDDKAVPDHVISAYSKLMRRGLFPKKPLTSA
jgi:AcrR family transcriptional regulator